MAYQNSISLGIKLQPSKEVQTELETVIRELEKNSNIDLKLDTSQINKSLKEFGDTLSTISSQIKNGFNFGSVFNGQASGIDNVTNKLKEEQKAIEQTANTMKTLSNTKVQVLNDDGSVKETLKDITKLQDGISKTITLTNDLKNKKITASTTDNSGKEYSKLFDEANAKELQMIEKIAKANEKTQLNRKDSSKNDEIKQAEAVNKALEEEYILRQKLDATKSKMQSSVNTLSSNSKNSNNLNGFIDESVIKNIQTRLNSINTNSADSEIKELQTAIKNLSSSEPQIVRVQNAVLKLENNLKNMNGKYSGLVGDSSSKQELNNYIAQIENLKKVLSSLNSGESFNGAKLSQELNKGTNASRELSTAVKNSSSALRLAQKDATTFGQAIKNTLQNTGLYLGTYQAIQMISNAFKSGVKTVIDMDTSLGNLNKVANMTNEQLLQMRDSAVSMGKELGRSSIEIANAQAEFGRLYKTQDEINAMTKVSVMGANVMDGVTSAEVAKGLTTVVSSMKLEAKDSMDILDSMNEIQNNFRVGASDMLNALAEVGSTAYTSGTNLKQVEGYITSIAVATGKSGDEIGNSFF